ncbi:MAG: phage tail tube protein [Roseateles sp.]
MPDPILIRNHAVLAKIETTSGTDAVPTATANAIKVANLSITPLEVQMVKRQTAQPYLGNTQQIMVSGYTRTEFDVEIAGAGAAGTAPQYGPLLVGCGFQEVLVASTSAAYSPISDQFKSLTLYTNIGGVLYKSLFTMGSVAVNLNNGAIPSFRFSFTGMYVAVTDAALPGSITYTDQVPVAMNKANTDFSIHGVAAVMSQVTLDMKTQIVYRNLANFEGVRYADRQPEGSVRIEANKVATKDWWTTIRNATLAPLSIAHGKTAGNIVEIACPKVQITSPAFDDDGGIQMLRGSLVLNPNAGNDELVITVR